MNGQYGQRARGVLAKFKKGALLIWLDHSSYVSSETSNHANSQLVQVIRQSGHLYLQVLALTVEQAQVLNLARGHGITRHVVPVVKDALWKCLSTCLLTQGCDKAKVRWRDVESLLV